VPSPTEKLDDAKSGQAEPGIHCQPQVSPERYMPGWWRQEGHQQKISRISGQHGDQGVDEGSQQCLDTGD
jgi:hypothetical protein